MATSVKTAAKSNQTPLKFTPGEYSSSSDSLPEASTDNDGGDFLLGLASKQHRGLNELRDDRDSKHEHIRHKFAHKRNQARQYYESQRQLAEENYQTGVCSPFQIFFRRRLKRELENIYERERNGMSVLLKGEGIELGLAARKHEGRERIYIRQCRQEWSRKHPAAPFWYDGEKTGSCSDDSTGPSVSPRSFI
ncbi:hypothetical protein LZ32DRAFT_688416 [Colletotrichum eremochloae]|nr:hypothetical protein LZ32DRAFT_688416 [Colletotrichum eremochloae]